MAVRAHDEPGVAHPARALGTLPRQVEQENRSRGPAETHRRGNADPEGGTFGAQPERAAERDAASQQLGGAYPEGAEFLSSHGRNRTCARRHGVEILEPPLRQHGDAPKTLPGPVVSRREAKVDDFQCPS